MNNNPTELERLVAVETKLNIVIDQQKDILKKVDKLTEHYVPRHEYEEDLLELKRDIAMTKKKTTTQVTITGILSALLGMAVTLIGLIIKSYFGL